MATPWIDDVPLISDGQQVKGSTPNSPLTALILRTQYLKEQLDSVQAGRSLYLRDAPVTSDVQIGHAVYYDESEGKYKKALAAVTYDESYGYYVAEPSTYVTGLVTNKPTPTTADIIIAGTTSEIDFTALYGTATLEAGEYYLSTVYEGLLTKLKPSIAVDVLFSMGTDGILIRPFPKDLLESHVHVKFLLYTNPSGTVSLSDGAFSFTTADEDVPGWLPADHAVFQGHAPSGAVMGYNICKHPELEAVFPPTPVSSAYLELYGEPVIMDGDSPLATVDSNGIWWYSLCEDQVPWASDIGGSSSSSSADSCPVELSRNLVMWFTRIPFKTDATSVRSLLAADGSPYEITDSSGNPATAGDLVLGFNVDALIDGTDDEGTTFVKKSGEKFSTGPGVAAIQSLSSGLVVSGTPVSNGYSGNVTLQLNVEGLTSSYGVPSLINLDNVLSTVEDDTLFYEFPADMISSLVAKLQLTDGLAPNTGIKLQLWILTRADGTLPALTAEWRRIPYTDTPVDMSGIAYTGFYTFDLSTLGVLSAGQYFAVESDTVAVDSGDLIHFRITRNSDAYAGNIGLLCIRYILEPIT